MGGRCQVIQMARVPLFELRRMEDEIRMTNDEGRSEKIVFSL